MGSDKGAQTAVSPALVSAQEKLLRLRQALNAKKSQGNALVSGDLDLNPHQFSLFEQINNLPSHLGWESTRVTAVLRQPEKYNAQDVMPVGHLQHDTHHVPHSKPAKESTLFIKVYPSVAQGILREGQAAAGRVWLLLRHLDENGRGWLTESDAQRQLTTKTSPSYLFGKRQWRNIIKKGDGIFWRRENGRLWLNSVSKTAAALGVWQLNGRPVKLPVSVLTGNIGTVRAHLYATFHSSRAAAPAGDRPQPKPIARESLTAKFNISPHTQRSYERKARVKSHKNFAIGAKNTSESVERTAWQHGTAVFPFTDHSGKQGRPGACYLAWQLPNHYVGPHRQACRGQQKRINRELADLFMKGMTGNDNDTVDRKHDLTASPQLEKQFSRRYCAHAAAAAKVYNLSQAKQGVYWQSANQGVWHVLEKSSDIGS